jgi:multiple sugar transport system ATP-binding protein
VANVSIQNLDIHLGGNAIISQLSLDVQDGEFLVLLGPSGCGKSTLLHTIAGLIDVTDGRIDIGGQEVTWADPKDRGIGMVFQSYALYPTMTVERNMSFGPRLAGVPKAEIERRVSRAAAMLHLTDLLQRKPAQLSGGQRQRVAIGRALVRDAAVFLFDEPLSNLDAKLRSELRRELKELHAELGSTMIYVTHDQVEAMTLASRIAVMRGGKIQQIDSPAMVYDQPANIYVAGFLGSPSMNFFQGVLKVEGNQVQFESNALTLDVSEYAFTQRPEPGQQVVMGIRPEDIWVQLVDMPVQPTPDATPALAATVRLVEPMGPNQVLWLKMLEADLGVTTSSTLIAPKGTAVSIQINSRRWSLFDAQTETRL